MPKCVAPKCGNLDNVNGRAKGLTFHRFPQNDPQKLQKWLDALQLDNWTPKRRSQLCSNHFENDCFDKTGQTVRLRSHAVPSLFAFPKHLERKSQSDMPMCAAWKCRNRTGDKGLSFHLFPRDAKRRKDWTAALRLQNFTPSNSSVLCSDHFEEKCFDRTGQTIRIRFGSIPTIFNYPKHSKKNDGGRKQLIEENRPNQAEEEVLPSKRRIKPKMRDDEIIEWGPRTKRIFVRKVTREIDDAPSDAESSRPVRKIKRSHEEEEDVQYRPVKRKALRVSQKSKSNGLRVKLSRNVTKKESSSSFGQDITVKEEPIDASDEELIDSLFSDEAEASMKKKTSDEKSIVQLEKTDNSSENAECGSTNQEEHSYGQNGTKSSQNLQLSSRKGNTGLRKDRIIQLPNNRMYFEFAQPKSKVILQLVQANSTELKSGTLQELLTSLRLRNLLSGSAEELLEAFGHLPKSLKRKETEENVPPKFPRDVRKFATMLYVLSSRAFDLVDTIFHLPEKVKLRNELISEGYWPGFTLEAIELFEKNTAEFPSKICSIMIDLVPLKKHRNLDNSVNKWSGHVDFCCGLDPGDTDGLPLATEVLMFTAVGLVTEWKIPFGYFPVNEICAEAMHNLVKEAIVILEESGLKVSVLVCDGSLQTVKMGILFGCNIQTKAFRELVTSFPHPLDDMRKIHLVFGMYHSLMLLKNLLAEKHVLRSTTYGLIRWKLFEELLNNEKGVKIESNEDNKGSITELQSLRRIIKHCHPSFNCMVNRAFELANELELKEFEDSDPTVNMLADVYRAFDMLNSRNPVVTGEKPPIKTPFIAEQLEAMTVIGQRIFSLSSTYGTPIVEEGRWMSVVLFPFTLKSVSIIASDLLTRNTVKYFTTYRVNLDHSDLILRLIQRFGGWSDIPTAEEFRKGYIILFENYIKSTLISIYSNDFDGDDLTVGQGVICPFKRLLHVPVIEGNLLSSALPIDNDIDLTMKVKCVIMNLSIKLSCTECMALLLDNTFFRKSSKKMYFDHIKPSKFAYKILKRAEKLLKVKLSESKTVNEERLIVDIFSECLELFGESYHIFYEHVLEEPQHVICLVKSFIRIYVNCRVRSSKFISSLKDKVT